MTLLVGVVMLVKLVLATEEVVGVGVVSVVLASMCCVDDCCVVETVEEKKSFTTSIIMYNRNRDTIIGREGGRHHE